MGAYPEHPKSPGDEPERSDSVTWIPRDRFSHGQPVEPPAPSSGMMDTLRRNPRPWIIGIVVLVLLAIAVSIARNAMAPKGADAAANQAAQVPLVSVVTPRVKAVTATVTFTGSIHARYDMPIGAEGESGRITAVLVEAGDKVKHGPGAGAHRPVRAAPADQPPRPLRSRKRGRRPPSRPPSIGARRAWRPRAPCRPKRSHAGMRPPSLTRRA